MDDEVMVEKIPGKSTVKIRHCSIVRRPSRMTTIFVIIWVQYIDPPSSKELLVMEKLRKFSFFDLDLAEEKTKGDGRNLSKIDENAQIVVERIETRLPLREGYSWLFLV
ncbi:unnamed protein product [Sphenostylis stenocarpa]|uniref:Uncharacterized protein n=1 Tax=Sphenostylis stenocarpa TaxID=92480 RepID=A0AA86S5I2_9FABA|nr:unnamed protein product [Sphenostylis stenocarpa]